MDLRTISNHTHQNHSVNISLKPGEELLTLKYKEGAQNNGPLLVNRNVIKRFEVNNEEALVGLAKNILSGEKKLDALFELVSPTLLLQEFDLTQKDIKHAQLPDHFNKAYLEAYLHIQTNQDQKKIEILDNSSTNGKFSDLKCLPKIIASCKKLKAIVIYGTKIEKLNQSFYSLAKLRTIDFRSVPLKEIENLTYHFPKLSYVNLATSLLSIKDIQFLANSKIKFHYSDVETGGLRRESQGGDVKPYLYPSYQKKLEQAFKKETSFWNYLPSFNTLLAIGGVAICFFFLRREAHAIENFNALLTKVTNQENTFLKELNRLITGFLNQPRSVNVKIKRR